MTEMTVRAYRTLLVSWSSIASSPSSRVCSVILNRPEKRNAIGPEMVNELRYVLADAAADDTVRALVLTGAGKAFCAGGDFAQMGGDDSSALPSFDEKGGDYAALMIDLVRSPKPVIARVNGHAMGGGLGLVASCTFAVASEEAQLGTPEVDVGLFPMMIMAMLLRLVPRRRLTAMMLLGERMSASEALSYGLLNHVVGASALDSAVEELVSKLAQKAPIAIARGLEAMYEQDTLPLEESLPLLRNKLGELLATDDAREGLMAFFERRKPNWSGR